MTTLETKLETDSLHKLIQQNQNLSKKVRKEITEEVVILIDRIYSFLYLHLLLRILMKYPIKKYKSQNFKNNNQIRVEMDKDIYKRGMTITIHLLRTKWVFKKVEHVKQTPTIFQIILRNSMRVLILLKNQKSLK